MLGTHCQISDYARLVFVKYTGRVRVLLYVLDDGIGSLMERREARLVDEDAFRHLDLGMESS